MENQNQNQIQIEPNLGMNEIEFKQILNSFLEILKHYHILFLLDF